MLALLSSPLRRSLGPRAYSSSQTLNSGHTAKNATARGARAGCGRFRGALLTSAAATAIATMLVIGSTEEAAAACPNAPIQTLSSGTTGANAGVGTSAVTINGTGTVTVDGNNTSTTDCAIYVSSTGSTIDIGAVTVSSDAQEAIQIDGNGNTLNFDGSTVTGTGGVAILDVGANDTTMSIIGSSTVTGDINMGDGVDIITIASSAVGDINMGGGDDILAINNAPGVSFGNLDGGAGSLDDLRLFGTDSATLNLNTVSNFEGLRKNSAGTWALTGTGTFTTFVLNAGVLDVQAGTVLNITGTVDILSVGGVNLVQGIQNVGGTTTVSGSSIQVTGVGDYNANGDVLVDGGLIDVAGGTFDAALLTTVLSGTLQVQGGTYTATGATLVDGSGVLRVDSGNYDALSTTTVDGGTLLVAGGTYTATGAMISNGGFLQILSGTIQANGGLLVDGGTVLVEGGNFNNSLTTTVENGSLQVIGGTYTGTGNVTVNGGNIQVASGVFSTAGATTVMGGTIVVSATGAYNAGNDAGDTTTVNTNGVLQITGGSYTTPGETNVLGGSLQVDGGTYQANNSVSVFGGAIFVTGGNFNAGDDVADTTTVDGGLLRVLGGTYTAAGVTNVASGTLQVDSGTYQANNSVFVGGGLLEVNGGTFNAAFSTQVSGLGTLAVQGGSYTTAATTGVLDTGVLRVDFGSYTATGITLISGDGIIQINGGIYTAMDTTTLQAAGAQLRAFGGGLYDASVSTIEVDMGTVLGTGTIAGVLNNNGGTVSPGGLPAPGNVGTLFLTGTYNQAAGGNFAADLQPGGPADRLAVTGSAALLGNVQINTLAANFGVLEQFRIISTDNPIPTIFETASVTGAGLGGNFAWVGRVNDAGVFNEADPATGNNVDVIVATAPGALEGLTPNQQAVADYLGNVAMPGGVYIEDANILLITQIVAGGPNALDQIGGEVYDSFTAFSFNIARQYGGLLDQRVRMLRCAAARGPSAPFCGSGRTLLADAGPGLAPGAAGTTSPLGFSPNTHPYGWSVWAQAIGSYLSKDRTTNNLGYSGWTGGGAIGVDLALSQRWIVGVLAGGTRSNIDFSGVSGDGDLEAVTVGVYTAWYGSRWFANAAFTYTKTWVEADRDLQFSSINRRAEGKTEGDQYAIHATVGYGFKIRKFSLEATGGVDWVQLRQYGFTETGAGSLNLTVGTRTDDSLRLRIGIRVARAWKVRPNLIISPSLRVGYAREVLDNTRPITSSIGNIGGSFTVNGDEGSRNILTYGGGIQADFSQGITLYFRHAGEWAGDRTGHTFNAGLKIRW